MAGLSREEVAQLVAWFQTAELPLPPFRTAPWSEVSAPEMWRRQVLWDLHFGPSGLYWHTALQELRWLAKRIAPPDVQATAHTGELVKQPGRAFSAPLTSGLLTPPAR